MFWVSDDVRLACGGAQVAVLRGPEVVGGAARYVLRLQQLYRIRGGGGGGGFVGDQLRPDKRVGLLSMQPRVSFLTLIMEVSQTVA